MTKLEKGTILEMTQEAGYATQKLEVLEIGTYLVNQSDYFYLVKNLRARKHKFSIISVKTKNSYHVYGYVKTIQEAKEWWERYSNMYGLQKGA